MDGRKGKRGKGGSVGQLGAMPSASRGMKKVARIIPPRASPLGDGGCTEGRGAYEAHEVAQKLMR